MIYDVQSSYGNLFDAGFYDANSGEPSYSIVSQSSTQVTVFNATNGVTTNINGVGLSVAANGSATGGTVSSFTMSDSSGAVGSISNISWGFQAFQNALIANDDNNPAPFAALLNQQAITVDLRDATAAVDLETIFENFVELVTQPVTVFGGPFTDVLIGASGNDTINFLGHTDGSFFFDNYEATQGNDTLVFTGSSSTDYVVLDYDLDYHPTVVAISANIDGVANTGTVSGAGFSDTLVDVDQILSSSGLGVIGTFLNDTFTVNVGQDQWTSLNGTEGNDTYNITLSGGTVRLDHRSGQAGDATVGANINLATGVIADGFGNTDTVNVTGTGIVELRGTYLDDVFVGSDGDEIFITETGNDSVDGGGGFDTLRYDRGGVDALVVDVQAGTVSGLWDNAAFTDTFTNIDVVRASDGNDTLTGGGNGDRLEGEGGDDTIFGGGGDDRLYGDDGDDEIHDGEGSDDVLGGWGDDTVVLQGSTNYDYVDLHGGNDIIDVSSHTGGFLIVNHWGLQEDAAFVIDVDAVTNTAIVNKGGTNGTTSLTEINKLALQDSVLFIGTQLDDVFNVNMVADGLVSLRGGRGNDTYNLSGADGSRVLLEFESDNRFNDPTSGIVVNYQTGVVQNDGLGGTDTIVGVENLELGVRGTRFADSIIGSDGDDLFTAEGGNDIADAGDGNDTISFGFGLHTAGVVANLSQGTVAGEHLGVGFNKSIANFEKVGGTGWNDIVIGNDAGNLLSGFNGNDALFGDGVQVASIGEISGQVYRLYEATLGRVADTGGHAGWSTLLATGQIDLQDAAAGFVNSSEFQNVYGALDNSGFVELLYQNVLGRSAGQSEIDAWLNNFDNGATRQQVVTGFSESQEFRNNTAADSSAFAIERTAAEWSDEIYRLYQATLDREPDAVSFKGWAGILGGGRDLSTVAGGFVESTEFQNVYGALTDSAFVDQLYQNVLGRTGSQAEIQGWLDVIDGGSSRSDVVVGFSQSLEFTNRTAADLINWVRLQGEDDILVGASGENDLMGGLMSDTFVFRPNSGDGSTVFDFEVWDGLALQDFDFASEQDALDAMMQDGANVVFDHQDTSFILLDTQLTTLTEANIYL